VATDVPVHPNPLYEAIVAVVIAVVLWRLGRHVTGAAVFAWYLILSGLARFAVEFLRLNSPALFGLTQGPVTALREVVPQMRAAGAQVIVVLSHLTYEEMEQVARQVDGVDVIVGSHVGPQPYGFLDKPRIVGRTILSVAGNDMAAVGELDLVVRRSDGRIVRFAFHRYVVTPGGPVSPAVKAVLDRYLAKRPR